MRASTYPTSELARPCCRRPTDREALITIAEDQGAAVAVMPPPRAMVVVSSGVSLLPGLARADVTLLGEGGVAGAAAPTCQPLPRQSIQIKH